MFRAGEQNQRAQGEDTSGLSLRRSPSQNVQHAVIDTSNRRPGAARCLKHQSSSERKRPSSGREGRLNQRRPKRKTPTQARSPDSWPSGCVARGIRNPSDAPPETSRTPSQSIWYLQDEAADRDQQSATGWINCSTTPKRSSPTARARCAPSQTSKAAHST